MGSNNIVIDIVENYIYFWNNQRILVKLGYLSPIDYRKKWLIELLFLYCVKK
ncbi:IS3 family transposase [Listeria immobilis]|uniref:IS3 family transposase n=1 Tax=Listeria immobilis TaxID=2713502 RepID=UPI0036F432FE